MEFSEYCPAATHYLHTTVTDCLTTTTDYLTQLHTTETDCLTTTTDYLTQLHTTETVLDTTMTDYLTQLHTTKTDCLTHYTPPRQISWQNIIAAGDLIRKCAVKVLKPLLYQSFPFIRQFVVGGGDAIAGLCLVIYYLDRVVARHPLHMREMWEPLPV